MTQQQPGPGKLPKQSVSADQAASHSQLTPSRSPLTEAVMMELQAGAELQTQSGSMAVLITGRKVNHILHLVLSVITAGIWLFVWLLLILTNRRQRVVLFLGQDGKVSRVVTAI